MSRTVMFNRRVFLQGAGSMIALPFLESLRVAPRNSATRFCFFYFPNGASMEHWRPARVGPLGKAGLPPLLRPLAPHLDYLAVASGLDNRACEMAGRPESTGQHARSIAAFLSAVYPSHDLRAGETIDSLLAKNNSGERIPLLNLATEHAQEEHDLGYSPVYNYSLSWKNERSPIQPIDSTRYAFELLCGEGAAPDRMEEQLRLRAQAKTSVLDSVLDVSKTLQGQLNAGDRRILDEYLDSIRAVERDIMRAIPPAQCMEAPERYAEPSSFEDRLAIMLDLVHIALRTNSARVVTLLFGAERSERDFGFLRSRAGFDMAGGHHSISHHKNNAKQLRKYARIGLFHSEHLARFLQKMKDTPDGDGNLLDRTFIVYGSSMADGNSHEHYNLPILIAGKGNGLIRPGREGVHVNYGGKPISNLYVTLLQKMAIPDPGGNVYTSFGDSGGTIDLPGGD